MGFPPDVLGGRPVVGICNSWSELVNCNAHLRQVAEAVKRGVWEAGGLPLEFPTISLGEPFMKPTTMLYRNLMAMDVEEMIRANPIDGVVLLCGCDKTTAAQLLGAASANLPAIIVPGGPMLKGHWRGREIGSGTDIWRFWDMCRVGRLTEEEFVEIETCMSRSAGHCMVMGTASTMASIVEAMGLALPGSSSIPAADSRHQAMAQESGRRIVHMIEEDLRPDKVLSAPALDNGIRVDMALGGSTNAVVHLLALAGRLGIKLTLEDFDRISCETPMVANVAPSGEFLMEDFFYAGGVPAVMEEIADLLHGDALTITGLPLGRNTAGAAVQNRQVIRPRSEPVYPEGGTIAVKGNLAPRGAVIKRSAATPELLQHKGKAVVFENRDDLLQRIDDPSLEVSEHSVLVLRNAGPIGGPGMPEWGHIPIPRKLLEGGVGDMLRVTDARMSGTAYGTVVLHVAPEAAAGGPLAIVKNGDLIELDAGARALIVHLSEKEMHERLSAWRPPPKHYDRGYGRMFLDHILQADEGCDFDFLCSTHTE